MIKKGNVTSKTQGTAASRPPTYRLTNLSVEKQITLITQAMSPLPCNFSVVNKSCNEKGYTLLLLLGGGWGKRTVYMKVLL